MTTNRIVQHRRRLDAARAYLNAVLDQVGDRWETPVYHDGERWNVRQVLIHLAETERGHNAQVRGYAAGREVVPADFDRERYNRRVKAKQDHLTDDDARAALAAVRADLLAWLETVDDAVLDLRGRNASLEIVSIGAILDNLAGHERAHAGDIARALDIRV